MKRYLFFIICCFFAISGMSQTLFKIGAQQGQEKNYLRLGMIEDTVSISKDIIIENTSEEPINLQRIVPNMGTVKFNFEKGIMQPKEKRKINIIINVNKCLRYYDTKSRFFIRISFYNTINDYHRIVGAGNIYMDMYPLWKKTKK